MVYSIFNKNIEKNDIIDFVETKKAHVLLGLLYQTQ